MPGAVCDSCSTEGILGEGASSFLSWPIVFTLPHRSRSLFSILLSGWLFLSGASALGQNFSWTVLTPENDSRDADVRAFDEFDSKSLVVGMNETEKVFHHQLRWSKVAIKDLLGVSTPFCELRFDAVKPLILTDREKAILREYFARGGFILFQEDAYPYSQDEFWSVKEWPVIDFLRKELPASSPDFKVEKVTDAHPLFRQYFETQTAAMIKHELSDNPFTPNRTLLTYNGRPCAFVYGRYNWIEDGKWTAMERPFPFVFSLEEKAYKLTVNIYVYATMR